MSAHRDLDRLIQSFLAEGPMELPDASYDEVRDRMEQKRQRAFIGPWRTPTVNRYLQIGLAAVAVLLIAAVVGCNLLPGSPTPGAETRATPEPSVAEPSPSDAAGLPVGSSHVLWNRAGDVQISVTIPKAGWYGDVGSSFIIKDDNADPPDGAGVVVFVGDLYVYGDPCHWTSSTPDAPATSVDEVIAALAAQASRDASAPADITVDGYAGRSITLHVPDDAVFNECDGDTFGSWAGGGDPVSAGPSRSHQGPGQIDEVWILDVNGVVTVLDWAYYEGTPAEVVTELRAIVESATFE